MVSNEINVKCSVKLDAYRIISDAVDVGICSGWNRAHKHTETPSQQHVIDELHKSIMNQLCEILKFDDEE